MGDAPGKHPEALHPLSLLDSPIEGLTLLVRPLPVCHISNCADRAQAAVGLVDDRPGAKLEPTQLPCLGANPELEIDRFTA